MAGLKKAALFFSRTPSSLQYQRSYQGAGDLVAQIMHRVSVYELLKLCMSDVFLFRDLKLNKGTILKASVEYIRVLRRDQEKMHQILHRYQNVEQDNKIMAMRIHVSPTVQIGWMGVGGPRVCPHAY